MEEFKLSKYPVYSSRIEQDREYRVDVGYRYVGYGTYELYAKVYRKRKRFGWKRVNELSYYREEKTQQWLGQYVGLAQYAVQDYEDDLIEQREEENIHNNGVAKFDRWNGKMEEV